MAAQQLCSYFYLASPTRSGSDETILVASCSQQIWTQFNAEFLTLCCVEKNPIELKLRFPFDGMIQQFAFEDEALESARQNALAQDSLDAIAASCFNASEMQIVQPSHLQHELPVIASSNSETFSVFRQSVVVELAIRHPGLLPDRVAHVECERGGVASSTSKYRETELNVFEETHFDCQLLLQKRGYVEGDVLPFNCSDNASCGFLRIDASTDQEAKFLGSLMLINTNGKISAGAEFSKRSVWRFNGRLNTITKRVFTII